MNKARRAFEDITINLRDSVQIARLMKVTGTGFHVVFQTIDPVCAPQPVLLQVGGSTCVLFMKFARDFEVRRTEFRRVAPTNADEPGLTVQPQAGRGRYRETR